jgi:hypothetical protein
MPQDVATQLNLIFFTVTPDDASIISDIIAHLGNLTNTTSLRDFARAIRPPTIEILQHAVRQEHLPVNIVSVDWPNSDLIQYVVECNPLVG